jgi:paraquat-inducible protein B
MVQIPDNLPAYICLRKSNAKDADWTQFVDYIRSVSKYTVVEREEQQEHICSEEEQRNLKFLLSYHPKAGLPVRGTVDQAVQQIKYKEALNATLIEIKKKYSETITPTYQKHWQRLSNMLCYRPDETLDLKLKGSVEEMLSTLDKMTEEMAEQCAKLEEISKKQDDILKKDTEDRQATVNNMSDEMDALKKVVEDRQVVVDTMNDEMDALKKKVASQAALMTFVKSL